VTLAISWTTVLFLVDALLSGTLFWHPLSCKTSPVSCHPAGSEVHGTAHAFPDHLHFFHVSSFHVQNIPCCRRYSGVGFAVIFTTTLLYGLKRCACWRGRGGAGRRTRICLRRPVVLSHSDGFHFLSKDVCKLMLIGKELPCILDGMLNEVYMSTIITMSKAILT